jgi:dTDP-4-dehydrorhamnose reductase
MKVLITGSEGQLGRALQTTAPAGSHVIASTKIDFDITDHECVAATIARTKPDVVFNAAAYTAVDKAESDIDRARLVNATAVKYLATACQAHNARLVHVSTDFVFNGKTSRAYLPDDAPQPLGIYGLTKYEGEQAAGPSALIVRTAWVYAPTGNNFVRTMLRLMSERDEVRVVADQIGTPTYAPCLAQTLWALAAQGTFGIYHHTDSGVASWYDFAVAVQEEALSLGLLSKEVPVVPIATDDFPTPAQRPAFSVLDKTKTWLALGAPVSHWRPNLRMMLREVKRTDRDFG